MPTRTRDTDPKFRRLSRKISGRLVAAVGVIGNKAQASRGAITNGELAQILERGTSTIPARPAFELTAKEREKDLAKDREKVAAKILTGQLDEKKGLSILGDRYLGWLVSKIRTNIPPQKKFVGDPPKQVSWIWTGQLVQALSSIVRGRKSDVV